MILTYNGNEIQQREEDNYVNLTQMAKANDVRFADWLENQTAKEYLKALQDTENAEKGTFSKDLFFIESVGFPAVRTQWAHPLVAIAFGQWISPQFHVWCNKHIKTLIEKGTTSLVPQTFSQALLLAGKIQAEKELLEIENTLLTKENHTLAEAVDELFDYSSIIRIAIFNKIHETNFSWHKLKAASIKLGTEIKKVPDPRFGTKNLYSHEAWRLAYPEIALPEYSGFEE